jgi:hypothetical protein
MSANLIDIDKPAKTQGGNEVIDLLKVGGKLEGFIRVSATECVGPILWSLNGYGMTVGYRDDRFTLRNVPERVKIDLDRPLRAVLGGGDVSIDYRTQAGNYHGTVATIDGAIFQTLWDHAGKSVDNDPKLDIENVPEPTDAEMEAEWIKDFRETIQNYVERTLRKTYDPSRHGEMQRGCSVGFVRLNNQHDDWEVWDLCEDFQPIDTIPYPIPGEEVGFFWNWMQKRERAVWDRGREVGIREGDQRRVKIIADAKLALERAEQGFSADPKDYEDED